MHWHRYTSRICWIYVVVWGDILAFYFCNFEVVRIVISFYRFIYFLKLKSNILHGCLLNLNERWWHGFNGCIAICWWSTILAFVFTKFWIWYYNWNCNWNRKVRHQGCQNMFDKLINNDQNTFCFTTINSRTFRRTNLIFFYRIYFLI